MRPESPMPLSHAHPGLLSVVATDATLAERRAAAARRRALAAVAPAPFAGARRGAAALLRGLAERLERSAESTPPPRVGGWTA